MPLALPGRLSQGLALWFASAWGCGSVPTAPECAVGSSAGRGWGGAPGPALEGHSERRYAQWGSTCDPGRLLGLSPVHGHTALPGGCQHLSTDGHPGSKGLRARSRPRGGQVPWPGLKLTSGSPRWSKAPARSRHLPLWRKPAAQVPGPFPTLTCTDLVGR